MKKVNGAKKVQTLKSAKDN